MYSIKLMDFVDDSLIIGRGSYGYVEKRGETAVKHFTRESHLVQEYAAGRYLFEHKDIVDIYGCDLKEKTMTMELYQGSLRDWLKEGEIEKTDTQKFSMLKFILKGFICLHDLGLVHGDVKPGNIVCNWDNRTYDLKKVCIADLGFVAPCDHTKAERTAPIYRDMNVKRDYRHDIYSLGVICLESFGKHKLKKQQSCESITKKIEEYIENSQMKFYTKQMISKDREERPTARKLYFELFGEDDEPEEINHPAHDNDIEAENINGPDSKIQTRIIEEFFKKYSEEKLKDGRKRIKRARLGRDAIISYINKENIHSDYHHLYSSCMLYILSAMFGESSYGVDFIMDMTGRSKNKILDTVYKLLESDIILLHIMY